jgi:hypothetical protein
MRLLLDESIPENLRFFIRGHDIRTMRFMGWRGLPDGDFLPMAQGEFDAVITCDQSIPNQQNLNELDLRIIVLHGRSNGTESLLPLLPEAMQALDEPSRGQVVRIYPPNSP